MQGVHDQSVAIGTWVHAGTYNSCITPEWTTWSIVMD